MLFLRFHLELHLFPTRRSSVLVGELLADGAVDAWACMYAQKLAFDRFHSN